MFCILRNIYGPSRNWPIKFIEIIGVTLLLWYFIFGFVNNIKSFVPVKVLYYQSYLWDI